MPATSGYVTSAWKHCRKGMVEMKYERNLEIMMAAIQAETGRSEEELREIRGGIIDGFLRIERLKAEEERALDRWCYFPVERVQEGFAFWNSGGFNTRGNIGRSAVAAGLEGERLKLVRYKSEYNGKHSLAVVYPGCFLAVSVANNTLESDNTMVYQILGFIRQENGYQAKCKKVFQMEPKRSLLTEGQEERLERIIGVANRIAISPNLRRLGNWV